MARHGSSNPPAPELPGGKAVELVHRYRLDSPELNEVEPPSTCQAAIERLREGNARFATFMSNCRMSIAHRVVIPCVKTEVGLGEHDAFGRPKQSPFALILGCSDAHEPAEILLGQGFDDLFTVRVAGNVLGDECVGSVIYALDKFAPSGSAGASGSLKLILVIGHRNCGAVHAAVEAHEADPSTLVERVGTTPHPLAAIVARIAPIVTVSAWAIDNCYGPGASRDKKHTEVLTELGVYLNAALGAFELNKIVKARFPGAESPPVAVHFGVFDLGSDFVQGGPPPYAGNSSLPSISFAEPPDAPEWFPRARRNARSPSPRSFRTAIRI